MLYFQTFLFSYLAAISIAVGQIHVSVCVCVCVCVCVWLFIKHVQVHYDIMYVALDMSFNVYHFFFLLPRTLALFLFCSLFYSHTSSFPLPLTHLHSLPPTHSFFTLLPLSPPPPSPLPSLLQSLLGISHNVRRVFVYTIYDLCHYITEIK